MTGPDLIARIDRIMRELAEKAEGNVVILTYTLESKPRDFDLGLLREAWQRWRGDPVRS